MFKKILGLILCVATVASTITPAYASKESELQQQALRELGIYQENLVTYDGFITSIAGFIYDDPAEMESTEAFAREMGMIEADEAYEGQSTLTVDKALKIAVIALGYKAILGTDGNYIKKASELGIAKGISAKGDAKLKKDVAAGILYEMIDAAPLVRTYGGKNGAAYEVASDETLLSINRDIYEVKGLLTGTETTSIYGGAAGTDRIVIDNNTYYVGEDNYDELLGKNVTAYIQKTGDLEDTAVYVGEAKGKNQTLIIDSEDIIEIGDSISYIRYEQEKQRDKTVDIIASPRVLYNGIFLEDYTENDFRHGTLELIDYDGNKDYDVIKITAYQTMIVETIDAREKIVKNRYRFPGNLNEIKLNEFENTDVKFRIFDGLGAETDFSAIKVSDVLSVAKSRDGKLMNIYISGNESVTGTITGLNNAEDLVFIDRQEFEKSDDFIKFLANTGKTLQLGDLYTFYFDHTGKIAFIKEKKANDYNVLIKVFFDFEADTYFAVHMDMDGDWYTTPISKKATVDGAKSASYETDMELLQANIKANPKVVILQFNSKNEILNIDTAGRFLPNVEGENTANNDSAFCSASGSYYYRDNRYFQKGSTSELVYPESDAKVVVIPQENREDEESWEIYSVGSFFVVNNYNAYSIEFFNPDKFSFSDLFLVSETGVPADSGMSRALYVVTGFKKILVDGDSYPVIEGSVDGFMNLSFQGEYADIFDGIEVGDVINFNLNNEGRVKKVEKKHSLKNFQNKQESLYGETALNAGTVTAIDYEAGKMVIDSGTAKTPFRVSPTMQVIVYYGAEGCESKSLSNVSVGDKVLVRTSWGRVDEIVCAKN